MKFKSIFILFNITMLFFFAAIILLPYFMLSPSFLVSFWRINWILILVMTLFFFGFYSFYFINRGLFLLLEREDWPALVCYLEERVIRKGRYSNRLVRLLANTYIVLSDSEAVISLESNVAMVNPALLDTNALIFGTARILGKDITGAIRFFETRKNTVKSELREWVHWYHGFALLLNSQFEEAAVEFALLAQVSKDGVITALSSFFLSEAIALVVPEKEKELKEISSAGRESVLKALPFAKDWDREVSRLSTEIHAAAISKYLGKTGIWLYS
ncbi:MAG: hypothetical protein LBH42_01910 [Treponema sp.]|nr:hypothetical protein [Treponema sp.]